MTKLLASREALLVLAIAVLLAVISWRFPAFVAPSNLLNVFNDTSPLILLAIGQMIVILTKCIDLSVAANLALTGMVVSLINIVAPGLPVIFIVLIAIGFGTLLGMFNGILVWKLAIPPIVVTLGTMTIFRGIIFLLTEGKWVNSHEMSDSFKSVPRTDLLGLPILSWIAIATVISVHRCHDPHIAGPRVLCRGRQPACGDLCRHQCGQNAVLGLYHFRRHRWSGGLPLGVPFCSGLCGCCGGFELTVVAACVIGGVSIMGGVGTVFGALLGALFLGIIANALPVVNISPFSQMAISGGAIIIAVICKRTGQPHTWPDHPQESGARHMNTRSIPDRLQSPLERRLKSWESLLMLVAIGIFVANSFASPYFLNAWNLSDATYNFTEKAMIAFAMALLIISGEIDLSVASIIALASTAMGAAVQMGVGAEGLVLIGLATGLVCGAFNGILGNRPGLAVHRGDHRHHVAVSRHQFHHSWAIRPIAAIRPNFAFFGQGYVWWVISFEFVLFAIIALIYGVILHMTNFGRAVYAIGNNPTGALFSGIRVGRVKFILFLLTGLMSGVAADLPDLAPWLHASVHRDGVGA